MVQDFPEKIFRTGYTYFPKDCTLKRDNLVEQY